MKNNQKKFTQFNRVAQQENNPFLDLMDSPETKKYLQDFASRKFKHKFDEREIHISDLIYCKVKLERKLFFTALISILFLILSLVAEVDMFPKFIIWAALALIANNFFSVLADVKKELSRRYSDREKDLKFVYTDVIDFLERQEQEIRDKRDREE